MNELQKEIDALAVRVSEFLRATRRQGRRRKWPEEIRREVLSMIAAGVSPSALTRKLNIPVQTFYAWRRKAPVRRRSAPLIELPVHAPRESGELRLVTERGIEIRGLGLDTLRTLLREGAL